MAATAFSNVKITGMSCAVPKGVEKTESCNLHSAKKEQYLSAEEIDEFIQKVGVRERHVTSPEQTTSDLCYVAADSLIKNKGLDPKSIDAIIFVTQTPDYIQPATAHVLHKRLGLSKDCIAFDVNLGCSGFVFGVFICGSLIQCGAANRVLLLCGEMVRKNPEDDIKNYLLFGDAGTATLLEKGESEIKCLMKSDGNRYDCLITPGGQLRQPPTTIDSYWQTTKGHMDGETVLSFTITEVPKSFKEFFAIYGTDVGSYDYFIFHQANLFMLQYIAKKLKIPTEKYPIALDRYGNNSSASIPLTIVDLCERTTTQDHLHLATSGFGIGLSWGVVSFDINKADVLPMIFTDDYYREAYRDENV